jgi:transposase
MAPDIEVALPDDPQVLQCMIRELLATLHDTQREKEQLRHRLDQLLRRLYGPKAERFNPNQPSLFADMTPPPAPAPEPIIIEAPPARRSRGHGRRRLPEHLPRRRVEHDLSTADKVCPCCHEPRLKIGEEVSEQLDYQPASLFVVEHVRFK